MKLEDCFKGGYFICGFVCVLIGMLYTIFIQKDFKSLTPKLPGYKSSQILFIVGSLTRGVGYIAQAIIMIATTENTVKICDPITLGLPGYILTIAYLLLFYLWASICVNLIANDSTTGVRERIKNVFNSLLIFILTLGVVLIGVIILSFVQNYDFKNLVHEIEAFTAFFRDFITATIIFVHSILIIRMSERPLFSVSYNESIYFWMLLGLVAPLYARSCSLIYYLYTLFNDKDSCTVSNFLNTFITAFIAELLPCFMILITRKRSGLLSVYDIID